jgi:hypothetical protein
MFLVIFFIFILANLGYITYGIRAKVTTLGPKAGTEYLLITYFFVYVKTNKTITVTNIKHFISVVIMAAQNEEEIRIEENPEQRPPEDQRKNNDGCSPIEVLETMRNLIVEMQVFKSYNGKLKKAQQEQQEINEVLL